MGSNHYDKRNKYTDEYLVQLYMKYGSQGEAARHIDVSRETIARAVRRAGIKLTGRRLNGKNQPGRKITDAELREESTRHSCIEIAIKHDMSIENVYKRARKMGLNVDTKNLGGHWYRRARRYGSLIEYDHTITLAAVRKKYNDVCQICGLKVNEFDVKDGHIRRLYPTVDHITPLSKGGTHTWGNVQLAHMACNSGKCDYTRGA